LYVHVQEGQHMLFDTVFSNITQVIKLEISEEPLMML